MTAARRPRMPPRRPEPSRRRSEIAPPPIEPRDARGIAVGLLVFAAGLAVAGVLALVGLAGGPAWSIAFAVGLLAIGAVGLYQRRTLSPGPATAHVVARLPRRGHDPLGLPARGFTAVFYVLLAVGLLGNVAVPLVRR